MPLRDHFRPPLDDVHSWDELHGGWPMTIVQKLVEVLPEPYFAAPGVHLGTLYFDVAKGGVSVATYAPPEPTLTLEPQLPNQDVYEVRIYDGRRNRQLVAAIEIVSPSNENRPENRGHVRCGSGHAAQEQHLRIDRRCREYVRFQSVCGVAESFSRASIRLWEANRRRCTRRRFACVTKIAAA